MPLFSRFFEKPSNQYLCAVHHVTLGVCRRPTSVFVNFLIERVESCTQSSFFLLDNTYPYMYNIHMPLMLYSLKEVAMKRFAERLEGIMELRGTKKDIVLLIISGTALLISIFDFIPLPFDAAWIAIILCGIPIILEVVIGLITSFDIKADVLVSLALIASICIGEDFAAGEVAFIMQLGALLEDLTVAKARAGIEKLVHLTPQTARIMTQYRRTNRSC